MMKYAHIAILLTLLCCGCSPIINIVAFHPDRRNVAAAEDLPAGTEELTIVTADNVKLRCLYLPSKDSEKLVLYFHGNAGNIYHRIPDLVRIRRGGAGVIGVSYRGYGQSEGRPTETGVYMDGAAAMQYAVEQLNVSEENIYIFGRSIGTAVAIHTAVHKPIGGLILVTPLTTGKQIAAVTGFGWLSALAGNSFNNIEKINDVQAPLLVVHGTQDGIIPISMGKLLFNEAKVEKTFVTIPGAHHNNLQDFGPKYWAPIMNFIKKE